MRQVLVTMVLVHTTGLVNPYSAPLPYFMPRKLKKVAFKQRDAFRGAFYKLVCGTAIGSPVTANMVMEDIEERALASFPISPQFWNWYVDDMCCVVPSDQIVQLLPHLSSIGSIHPNHIWDRVMTTVYHFWMYTALLRQEHCRIVSTHYLVTAACPSQGLYRTVRKKSFRNKVERAQGSSEVCEDWCLCCI